MGTIKWVSVEKELPPEGMYVLIWGKFNAPRVGELSHDPDDLFARYWEITDGNYYDFDENEITHWAHINAPESEGKNEQNV